MLSCRQFMTTAFRCYAAKASNGRMAVKRKGAKSSAQVIAKSALEIVDDSGERLEPINIDTEQRTSSNIMGEQTDGRTAHKRSRPTLSTRSEPVVYRLIQSCLAFPLWKPEQTPSVADFSKHIEQTLGPFFDTGGACFDFRKETVEKKVGILLKNKATMRQIVEIPDFLLQNVELIERRLSYLRRRGVAQIYPAMLHHSLMEGNRVRPYERECSTYLDVMTASRSEIHADYVANTLSTDSYKFSVEAGALVVSTYFLRTCHCILLMDMKLQYLRERKVNVEHVAINLSNFFMRSPATIKQRCEMLASAGLSIDLAAVLSTYTAFKHWFELGRSGKLVCDKHKAKDRFTLLATLLKTSPEQMMSINYMRSRHLAQLDRLLRLLVTNGIKPSEILSHSYVFEYRPVPRLLEAAEYLISKGLTPFTLTQLEKLSIDGRLVRPYATISRVMGLAKALQCPASELTGLVPVETKRAIPNFFTAQKRIKFLTSRGFSIENIRRCPLILLHDEKTVVKHLDELPNKPEMKPYFEKWENDQQKTLGAVEYFCERENNFTLPVAPPS